jgi:hypothetical protein
LPADSCLEQAICQNKRRCFFYEKRIDGKEDSGQKRQFCGHNRKGSAIRQRTVAERISLRLKQAVDNKNRREA